MKKSVAYFKLNSWILAVLLVVNVGCSNRKIFEEYERFEKLSWHRFNFLEFEAPIENIETVYNINIFLRHLPEFPLQQIPVNITIYSPSGEMRSADYELHLTDEEGNRLSECLGDFCDIEILVRKGFIFSEKGIFKFRIENKWPKIELPGILEVGLIIKKTN